MVWLDAMDDLAVIERAVAGHHRRRIPLEQRVPAAVLVPFLRRGGALHLLLEKRAAHLNHHRGQIAFPGGARELDDDSAVETALREADEEVGLPPRQVTIYGMLDDLVTVTGFRVTPVVGRIPDDADLAPSPDEVDELLFVPWSLFLDDPVEGVVLEHDGHHLEVAAYPFEHHHIWGATARIIGSLVELVAAGEVPALEEEA